MFQKPLEANKAQHIFRAAQIPDFPDMEQNSDMETREESPHFNSPSDADIQEEFIPTTTPSAPEEGQSSPPVPFCGPCGSEFPDYTLLGCQGYPEKSIREDCTHVSLRSLAQNKEMDLIDLHTTQEKLKERSVVPQPAGSTTSQTPLAAFQTECGRNRGGAH